ncbi:MAG: HgcAB-associated protein [Methanothrix sp.]|nr:HgcAB-associated protein [Methanothrix sp.]
MEDELAPCCMPKGVCCRVESIVSVDERGQMVLPKEVRERAGVRPGEKMALICWEREGQVLCISLLKVEEIEAMVRSFLGPVAREMLQR